MTWDWEMGEKSQNIFTHKLISKYEIDFTINNLILDSVTSVVIAGLYDYFLSLPISYSLWQKKKKNILRCSLFFAW